MTKTRFYTLRRLDTAGTIQAIAVNGYTDGAFNYYKMGRVWFAIVPEYGISLVMAGTRKEAAILAFNQLDELQECTRTNGENLRQFFLEKARSAADLK